MLFARLSSHVSLLRPPAGGAEQIVLMVTLITTLAAVLGNRPLPTAGEPPMRACRHVANTL